MASAWEEMTIEERYRKFLKEYKELCLKYGIKVEACGCCDSPWMLEAYDEKDIEEHIEHLKEEMKRTLKCYRERELPEGWVKIVLDLFGDSDEQEMDNDR